MAKADKKAAAAKPEAALKVEKPKNGESKTSEFKYGVKDLAEKLNIRETSVRVKLRNCEVPKAGRSYGWNTKDELNAVAAAISKKAEKEETAGDSDDE